MGNDIEIRVRVANNTATGLAAVNRSLDQLRDQARDAGRGLDGLTERATAASIALRALKDSAQDAARALRSLNTAARNADTRMTAMSDRSRTLRRDTDELDGSMRRLTGTMGQLRGNNGRLTATFSGSSQGLDQLKTAALMLVPALLPIAAATVPIIANVGAAGAAVGAFGLAIAGQLVAVKDAADAQKKYDEAVKKHGPASKQATQAEAAYLDQLKGMDPASRRAAASLTVLTDQYKQWSKSLAGDTMPVFTKGLAVAGALLPKLTPAVKGAAGELDRFMTILGGGVQSGAFSKFMESFSSFATGALSKANDSLVHFMRTMSEGGGGSGKLSEFMDYVRKAGPQVGDTLLHLSEALVHVVTAASDTGLSMLGFVNAVAKLVSAIPPGVLSTFLQFAVALKAVKMAAAGMAALGGLSSVAAAIGAMRTAAAGATGPLASLSAAFGALSRSAKVALIGTGIGLLVIALSSLSEAGKAAPPDIDKLTTSLGKLADTGKVSGEAARAFGKDLSGLGESLRTLARPSNMEGVQQFLTSLIGMDSTPVKKAKEDLDAVDKALANMVKGGKADLAAAAVTDIAKAMEKQGLSSKELKGKLDDYRSALADQALEAKLTAESQGLFGAQAQATAAKLDAQKASADGLRGALQALNDVQRAGLGGMIGFEAAVDAAAQAAKDNAGALSMTHGVLDLNSEKARAAASALQDLADKTDGAAASARESGASWETVNGIYSRGRSELIRSAEAMGLNKEQARQLADQILKIPDKKAKVRMDTEDARAGLEAFNAAVKRSPGSKKVTLQTLSGAAEKVLEAFGYKVTHLKDGRVSVTAATGGALRGIGSVSSAIGALDGKSANTYVNTYKRVYFQSIGRPGEKVPAAHRPDIATGGPVPRYASGGAIQHFPNGGYVQGPGTGTSDSIFATFPSGAPANISNTEYVIKADSVRKYGVKFLDALNEGRLPVAHFAKGGKTKPKIDQAQLDARRALSGSFGISAFGRLAGYQRTPFEKSLGGATDVNALVSSLNEAASRIKAAFSGKTETRLLKQLNSVGKALIGYEKKLTTVTASLDKAKDKLSDLKNASSQLASSVKGNLISSANITKGASGEGTVTLSSIRSNMRMSKDKVTAFASALKQLRAKGFSKSIIQQVAEAGIDGGGLETAGALLQASASEIKTINDTQAQIEAAAGSAGKTAADAVYDKAIKQQERYVKALEVQQKLLTRAMDRLAKVMEQSIKSALGKKASGGIVGAAASGGLRSGLTLVGEQGPELAELPMGSRVWSNPDTRRKLGAGQAPWASMLTAPRRAPAGTAAAATGPAPSQPIVLELRSSGSHVDELLLQILRKAIRVRGGNVNFVLTGRP
ncbi:phage tail protein [Streptomyces sp. SCL15-4]|uniref:phage tail protein n=1 Tax=Streptomyces sp. SCL15-4 TaxID=2967221 RepID=UPI002965F77A|nr:phage tail protein [Streptomyces sp. SCL15-4]